jgi:hypothetical protein
MNSQTQRSDTAHRRHPKKMRTTTTPPVSQQKILLVDDDCGARESLAGVLTEECFLVLPAASGAELMIARSVCHALELGMASEKRIPPMRRNTSLGWINCRRALPLIHGRVTPHSKQPAPSLVM